MEIFTRQGGAVLAIITDQRVHVSVQIEGNTNSSFLNDLGSIYGAEHVLVYKASLKRFIRLSNLPQSRAPSLLKVGKELLGSTPFFNNNSHDNSAAPAEQEHLFTRKELPQDTEAVHGQFTPSLFKGIFDNPFISIILKDPLERMISLYEEWNNAKGETDWRIQIPYDKTLPFPDFAFREGFSNFQSKCLGNRRLGDFDLVGVSECQPGFIAQLKNKDWTGFVNPKVTGYQLEKPRYKNLGITADFVEEFQLANHMDYAIHQQAKEFIGYC
jgi:hypothetical protein